MARQADLAPAAQRTCQPEERALSSSCVPPAIVPSSPARRTTFGAYGVLVALSLGLNVGLGGWLWQTQSAQNRRLARLEALTDSGRRAPGPPTASGQPRQASRSERIAFLLAAAGNADQSKEILAAVPSEEVVEIARALIARPAANDRNEALDATLRYLAADNPARAVELLVGVEESGLKTRLARHVVAVWTATGPDAVARWLADGGGSQFFAGPKPAANLPAARAHGPPFPGRQLGDELAVALAHWSSFAPEAAARFIDARPPDGDLQPTPNSLSLGQACLEWARKDTAAALAWVQGLPATDPRQLSALDGVIQAWTEQDPAGAAGFVRQAVQAAQLPGVGSLAVVVVQAWSAKDADAAARWSMGLPDPAVRQLAMREAAARWAQADPMGAARWASGLPADRARGGVWVGMTERWADVDSARAETWLEGLPAGRDRDEATAVYINRLAPSDPEKALTWARTLTGPSFAEDQVSNVLAQWAVKDPAAARNWAAANGTVLPPIRGGR